MNLFLIFFTGLTTGGLSCLAVQGGLLASVIANQKGSTQKRMGALSVGMFLTAKVLAYTLVGFVLGLLGSAISLSLGLRLTFQTLTAFFMIATAMHLLNVHPIFRYLAFTPPKWVQKRIRSSSKSKSLFAPAVLGFFTIFIPCGVTQAMEVLAINTGSAIQGALIMFFFVLGTTPLFALLGLATVKLSTRWHDVFNKVAAVLLICLGLFSLNGVLIVIDSSLAIRNLPSFAQLSSNSTTQAQPTAQIENGVQQVTIAVQNQGYTPQHIKVKQGVPVNLTLTTSDTYSCAVSFVFPEFGIRTFLEPTDSQSFQFTPQEMGTFNFSCSMGMYTGTLEVI